MTEREIIEALQAKFRLSGMSYMELADTAGLAYLTAYKVMTRRYGSVRLNTIIALCNALGCEFLMKEREEC